MTIKNQHILITGAARGLGRAMAKGLAQKGATLTLVDRHEESLSDTLTECKQYSRHCFAIGADVADEQQVENMVKRCVEQQGALNGLINNAGILRDGLLVKTKKGVIVNKLPLEQWQAVIDVNLTGVFLCGREVAASMIEQGSNGVIINISSISRAGNFGQSNYSAAKAGVAALTTTWAKELARHGIRCAGIAPGMIETEMTAAMKPELKEKINAGIPLGHMGSPANIADTVAFIIENSYINGRIIEVDGGLRL
ncbi:SDR family oxidoreductase [Candidatus Sororendozoicomonas aggregata]|uniref:SDR family oxidoreductase n=1 Tax=Candidatus Sororendozoicomonas aggregata TaxID=3073239 RepID=UPI002ED1D3EE